MRILGTIEARMGSSRLPGKTLSKVYENIHLLECVVRRFQLSKLIDDVVVATTTEQADDPIAEWCDAHAISLFRGSEDDVLDRVVGAAEQYNADAIVQMGADSAYLDYELVDQLVGRYVQGGYDYVCNDLKLTYPLGIYAHVVNVGALYALNQRTTLSTEDREDVVRYIWEHPEQYRIYNIEAVACLNFPELRLTIDYPEDMTLAINLYEHFKGYRFTTPEIIAFYQESPRLFEGVRDLVQASAPFLPAGH